VTREPAGAAPRPDDRPIAATATGPTPTFWRSPGERRGAIAAADGGLPTSPDRTPVSRRSFLRAAGFTAAGTALASCARAPVEKAIPFLVKPEEITPGRAVLYASTCAGCTAACGALVKVRDGRPIKLEGNPEHPLSRGGLCAVAQAAPLGLYDSRRLRGPAIDGAPADWAVVDREVGELLAAAGGAGRGVRLLTTTVVGPTVQAAIDRFLARFTDARHVVYDALSSSAILDAHARTHGVRVLPRYRFERAAVIASFDADFLGTWISPVEFASGWRSGRELAADPAGMSYHVQLEGRMSLTGTRADRRIRLAPQETGPALTHLAVRLAARAGAPVGWDAALPADLAGELERLADRLWSARGRALVVSGVQDVASQVLVNFANHLLGAYGATLDLERPSRQRRGSDSDLAALLEELRARQVGALLVAGCDPVAELPGGEALAADLAAVPLVVSFASHPDETAAHARFLCPDHHPLEAWGDAEPAAGTVSVRQPTIAPLANTRALVESLAAWSGAPAAALDQLRHTWREQVFSRQDREADFERFWVAAVERGVVEVAPGAVATRGFDLGAPAPVAGEAPPPGSLTLVLHPQVGMLAGQHADNAWLHELPDPVTKVTWDNVAALAPATARRLGVEQGDVVRLTTAGGERLEVPAYLQPGQHEEVVAVALGYGRRGSERFARVGPRWLGARPGVGESGRVGVNAAPLLVLAGGTLRGVRVVRLEPTGRTVELACTQEHHTITVPEKLAPGGVARREVVEETSLAAYLADPGAGGHGGDHHPPPLWPDDHPATGHRWAMAVDLSACTGCSACVVACQVENNVPVVGRDEVRRRREMHWLRIDRYYSGDDGEVETVHQPMLCQHCDNAPCETVCPVLATVHSAEGLNQQVYNRCVGTRYCANNCPYKVRRFNWFDYPREDRLANLALNPDVTVRSRGVMEKCTFCVQRLQEAKLEARRLGEPLAEGSAQPACQQSCPARAIVFGDRNDPASAVSRAWSDPRRFRVLEEVGVEPAVAYLRLVRNRDGGEGRHG